jgi:hypothetical protein
MIIISLFCILRKEVRSTGRIWPNFRTSVWTWQEPNSDSPNWDQLHPLTTHLLILILKLHRHQESVAKLVEKNSPFVQKFENLLKNSPICKSAPFFFYSSKLCVEIKTWVFCTQIVTNSVQRFKTSGWMGLPRISNGQSLRSATFWTCQILYQPSKFQRIIIEFCNMKSFDNKLHHEMPQLQL